MKIIIPMAGRGKRFNDGYFHRPKPLMEIDGKPMIEHVVNMFSHKDEFIFICHQEHLEKTNMQEILSNLVHNFKIIPVNDEQIQGGPIYTCRNAFDLIGEEEIIINYCDFTMLWNYEDFLETVRKKHCDGAIPSFKDFHPASLGNTYYAYMKFDENDYLTELREKEPFSAENRMNDYASTGTYYFKRGSDFKKYAQKVIEAQINVKGEAYVTLPYILMVNDGLKILNYEVKKFICWGTPRDYEIYKFWSEFFFHHSGQVVGFNNVNIKTINIFPVAGDKYDFKELGIEKPNYLIPLMNKPLISSTVQSHPKGIRNIFICLEKDRETYQLNKLLRRIFYNTEIIYLNFKTKGNAATILKAEKLINPDDPVCVSGNDYIFDYDERRLSHLMEKEDIDVILLSFTHHECVLRDPNNRSYLKVKDGFVEYISEKKVISDNPYRDYAFTGTAIYKRASDLFDSIKKDIAEGSKVPFFLTAINELIKDNKKVALFEIDKYISLTTPLDYQEFIYWQDYFDSLPYHPYSKMAH